MLRENYKRRALFDPLFYVEFLGVGRVGRASFFSETERES